MKQSIDTFEDKIRKQFENVGYSLDTDSALSLYIAGAKYAKSVLSTPIETVKSVEGFTGGEWKWNDVHDSTHTRDIKSNGKTIATVWVYDNGKAIFDEYEAEANAQRIVKAVNNHDALVSALKVLQYQLQTHVESNGWDTEDESAYELASTILNSINQ